MKKLLSFLLALMMGLPLLIGTVSFPAAAAEGMVGQVSKQNELIKTAKALDKMPRTFDAVIKLPAAYKGRAGVILGNYMGGATTCISFEINDNGIPRLYYQDGSTVYNHLFTQVDIRSDGEPVRLTLVQDPTAKTVTCYLNGEAKQTVAASSLPDEILPTNPMVLGGDLRGDNGQFFKGTIYKVALYTDALTADQIKAGNGTGLLASYDFTAASNQAADLSGNGYALVGKLNLQDVYSNVEKEPVMTEGMEFDVSSRYQTGDDGLTKVPYTYSAWIYLPKSTIDRGGVIFGNYKDNSTPSFSMEIYSNGVPRFYQLDSNKKTTSFTFPNADVRTGDWAHLVFTVTDVVTCYLNGKNVGESAVFAYDEIPFVFPFCIGGDLRSGNAQYFKGRIREIALFSEVLTASKVETLYKEGAAAVGKELIAYYDLSNVKANEDIKDTTGNGNTVFCDPRFFAEKAPVGEYAYSFAFVGDTQIVTEKYPNELSKIYDWILANKDAKKIAYVLGLGDITNSDTDQEWATALSQISKLDGKLPYSLVRGNHDSVKQFTKNFSTDVYRKQFEGFYEDGILNTWRTFKAGKTDYLMITLDYGASDAILNWAGEVIAAHPEHRVIITTHAYFFRDGTTLGANDVCPPATTGGSNNGDDIWKKLISKYENIVLVVSGHDPCENIVARQAKGEHGNTVTQVLIDPQGVDAASGATGMVAMFYFSEDGNSIEVECYSTVREKFFLAENQFKINIPQTEKKPETTKAPETTSAPETTAAPADTDAPAVTTAPTTTPAPAVKDGSSPVGIIIAVAAVVVIAVVVGVILVKKKKA